MFRISAKWRINLGLISLLTSVMMIAISMGIVPDWRRIAMSGRTALCEALAVNSSVLVTRGKGSAVQDILEVAVQRNEDMLSAAVRKSDGKLVAVVGDHAAHWTDPSEDQSTGAHIRVPIWNTAQDRQWGTAEFSFQHIVVPGPLGRLLSPWTRFVAFVCAASGLCFVWYLHKMLAHMDPSKAVPGRVRSALDTLAEGLVVLDSRERIVLANDAFAKTIGEESDALVGRRLSNFAWSHVSDDVDQTDYPWTKSMSQSESPGANMLQLSGLDDLPRTYVVNCAPIMGQEGKQRGVLVSFEDVTPLEEKKTELKRAKAAAESANRAKTEFLANMSHEIRTPMNAILGFTDVLRRGFEKSPVKRQEHLSTIHASGQHLLNLINDILDLSKVEAGRLELEMVRCSPHRIAVEVLAVLTVKSQEKGISLEYRPEGLLPETIVTDPGRLRQTLMNLVGNAIKFTDTGGVTIAARMQSSSNTSQIVLEVIDTGIGMAPEAQEKIFEPFAQADGSFTRRFGGTGLGLAISRRFAEALGGELEVHSELGGGSVFTFSVDTGPLEDVAMISPEEAQRVGVEVGTVETTKAALPPARILVVDDGDENRELLALVLQEVGVETDMADNGQRAVELATRQTYDVILMDMQMPIMDGYTAARTLRDKGYEKPIVALTAHAMAGDEEKCRDAGCSGFLTKPIDIDALFQTLADILGAQPMPAPAMVPEPAVVAHETTEDASCDDHAPLISTLPTHKPQFAAIVQKFTVRLTEQLDAMQDARDQHDLSTLAQLAHWLKGSGGNVGFAAFVEPAQRLEALAKQEQTDDIDGILEQLRKLASRIEVPNAAFARTADPDRCDPDNPQTPTAAPGGASSYQAAVDAFDQA